jgi:hypothetical protein
VKHILCMVFFATAGIALAQTQTTKTPSPAKKPTAPAPKNPTEQLPFADARDMTVMIFWADAPTTPGVRPLEHRIMNTVTGSGAPSNCGFNITGAPGRSGGWRTLKALETLGWPTLSVLKGGTLFSFFAIPETGERRDVLFVVRIFRFSPLPFRRKIVPVLQNTIE